MTCGSHAAAICMYTGVHGSPSKILLWCEANPHTRSLFRQLLQRICAKYVLYRFDLNLPHVLVLNTSDTVVHTPRLFRLWPRGRDSFFSHFRRRRKCEKKEETRPLCRRRKGALTRPPRPSFHKKGEDEPKDAEGRSQIDIRYSKPIVMVNLESRLQPGIERDPGESRYSGASQRM